LSRYHFDWVDAFTAQPFGGNGCAVFHDADDVDDTTCMAIVRETSLSECTFLGPSAKADLTVRYFLAGKELPFAGHPTIATVASLIDRDLVTGDALTLETKAGLVPVTIDRATKGGPTITMTQIRPDFEPPMHPALVAAVGGLSAEDIIAPPRMVSTGARHCITVLRDHDTLRRVRLDLGALGRFNTAAGLEDSAATEPFWVTLEGATEAGDTFARLLLPPPIPAEDPFTGSATGEMAAYLWAEGLIDRPVFTAAQGHWLGRPGQACVEVLGPRDDITGVRVGGQGFVLMRGEIEL